MFFTDAIELGAKKKVRVREGPPSHWLSLEGDQKNRKDYQNVGIRLLLYAGGQNEGSIRSNTHAFWGGLEASVDPSYHKNPSKSKTAEGVDQIATTRKLLIWELDRREANRPVFRKDAGLRGPHRESRKTVKDLVTPSIQGPTQ